jgi:hypothetical protein
MSVDERSRLQLAEALKRVLGDDEGITMMELVPPVGWADVATKYDLRALEARIDPRFERLEQRMDRVEVRLDDLAREIRAQTWKLTTVMTAIVGVVVAAVRL